MDNAKESGKRLWLIGGTTESADLAAAIARAHLPCTITVTTEAARSLYPPVPGLRVLVGRLEIDKLEQFFQEQNIVAVLDASHPYAVDVSKAAIAITTHQQIPYLRYERPAIKAISSSDASPVIQLDSFNTLLAGNYLQDQRVLLTIGYKPLISFQPWQDRSMLFARIIPSLSALTAATKAGFTQDRLFAIRPPVSAELEKALWRHWNISLVVTKASGTPGGEDIKRDVAAELGISLIVITRPDMDYPQQTSNLSEALEFCRQHL